MVTAVRLLSLLLAVLALSFAAGPAPAAATSDELDPSFGTGGVATIEVNNVMAALYGIALQDDGKIVVSGRDQSNSLAAARLTTDGALDSSFAGDGVFVSDSVRGGLDVAVADDAKILVSGSGDLYLQRLNSDGTADTTFSGIGATGSLFTNPDDPSETYPPGMMNVIPWPGGGAIVGGTIDYGPYFFTFARHNNDGAIDTGFGDDGQIQTDFSPPGDHPGQAPLALAGYGAGFVAGGFREQDEASEDDSVIAVYDENGQLDDSFGDDGKTTNEFFAGDDQIEEVLPLDDGRIVAVGDGEIPQPLGGVVSAPFIARYDADGTLNSTFGGDGVIIFNDMPGGWDVTAAALGDDGSIIIGGNTQLSGQSRMFFARFDSEGNPDTEFGDDGWLVLDILGATASQLNDLAIDENGDIIGAGSVTMGGGKAAVVKLGGTPAPQRLWGDVDCDGEITTRDNQAELRFVLQQNALSQTEPCPDIGEGVTVDSTPRTWGDEDCDTEVSTRDNQAKLRFVLQQNALSQTEPCPDVGEPVVATGNG